jgi:DNA-binding PadR family transcriptional regulator
MPESNAPSLSQTHAELLVLSVLAEGSSYGYAVSKAIEAGSGGEFSLGPARLYPLLSRLEKQGLVTTSWEEVRSADAEPGAAGRRRKWYTLSAKGERRLAQHVAAHRRYTALIEAFLPRTEGEPA